MALKVIGAGFGRTGTLSLKLAFEQLGFGPCYHMFEVRQHPEFVDQWIQAGEGVFPDWNQTFRDYSSAVDWPACDYWQELAAYYPAAKVVLTVRDSEAWFNSTQHTIFGPNSPAARDGLSGIGLIVQRIAARHFGGKLNDKERLIEGYLRHNAEIERAVPAERLLVYQVTEEWTPLCQFLGLPIPSVPFPDVNSVDDFRQR